MGGGDWIIVNFNSFSDLLDESKIKWASSQKTIPIEKTSYTVPQGYRVTDGVSPLVDAISNTK